MENLMKTPLAAGILLALTCAAQNRGLAPETLLLSRIRAHMASELEHLPNYTCLETIDRFHAAHGGPLKPLDVLQLEIVYSDRNEWYSSPGDRSFTATEPSDFTSGGFTGTGTFALTLYNIFVADATLITWHGNESLAGRPAARYDYRIPSGFRPLVITVVEGRGASGEVGSFWIDPATLDLLAIESYAEDIPPFLPVAEMVSHVAYAHTRIGDRDTLLAQHAEMRMLKFDGDLSFDRSDFTHCRSFQTESAIHYGEPSDAAPEPAPKSQPAAAGGAVAPFLNVTIRLAQPITDRDVVGTLIQGRIAADVLHKGRIVLPRGSLVRGRIRRLDRYDEKTYAVGLEFTDVDAGGVPLRFYADLLDLDRRSGAQKILRDTVLVSTGRRSYTVTLTPLPGVASFFVPGQSFTLPAGFETVWRTRGLLRQ